MTALALTTNAGDYVKVEKNVSGNSLTVPLPANARVGDVLVATYASDFAGPVTTETPGWVRISAPRAGNLREVAVFHAFTVDGLPAPPVFTQGASTNPRATAAMYRVTGASQTVRQSGQGAWPATADSANTRSFTIPATGSTVPGVTIAVGYNNANSAQGATSAAAVTFNGNTATSHMVSYGVAATTGSSTNSAVFFSSSPGPFVLDWGKAIANSYGVAVTIPAADASSTPNTGKNVVVNADAEQSMTGWTPDGLGFGTIVVDTTRFHSGTRSWKASGSGGMFQEPINVTVGDSWKFSWWYWRAAGQSINGGLRLQTKGSDGLWINAVSNNASSTTVEAWVEGSTTFVIPAGVTQIRARVAFAPDTTTAVWFDDLSLVNLSAPTTVDPPVVVPPVTEPTHPDETGVTIQVGTGNVTQAAMSQPGVAPSIQLLVPANTVKGDVLLAVITHSLNSAPLIDASWTLLSTVRTGSNHWMAVYGYPVSDTPPYPGPTFSVSDVGARLSGVLMRLTGVELTDYKAGDSGWQVTAAEVNKTTMEIPGTNKGVVSLVAIYAASSAGQAMAGPSVAGATVIGQAAAPVEGQATTLLSVWRATGTGPRTVTFSPAAANAAGFQLTFQGKQVAVPASWEARVMQNGKLVPAVIDGVNKSGKKVAPSVVSWSPRDYTLDDLFSTTPFFIAHRGSGDTWPEHTMESYNNSTAYGVKALEVSVNMTKDNVLICHHDKDFVKTANDPRLIADMTYDEIKAQIRIDTSQWTGLSSTLAPPPLAKDVVDAFIGTHVIFIEDKGGTAATQLLNLMDTYPRGKEKFVWKQWAGAGQWAAAKARGYKTWGYFMADIFSRIPELAPNFDYLGIPHTASDQVVADIVAQGKQLNIPVIMWEIHWRWMMERALALGVRGMMTSNIPYVYSTRTAQFTEDQWHTGIRPAGDLPHSTDAGWSIQPQIDAANGGVARFIDKASAAMSMGSMCPVATDEYAIEYELRYTGPLPADAAHAGIYTSHDEDRTHRTNATSVNGGYHIIQRMTGVFDLYRHDAGASAGIPLASVTAARPVAGQWMRFRVEVRKNSITAKRLDGTPVQVSSDDALYRGGYFGLQKNYTTLAADAAQPCEFRSVKVLPL